MCLYGNVLLFVVRKRENKHKKFTFKIKERMIEGRVGEGKGEIIELINKTKKLSKTRGM